MRLFFAIDFNSAVKAELDQMTNRLKQHSKKGSFTRKENHHLTLAFIGETDQTTELKRVLDLTIARPFTMETEGIGIFSNRRKPKEGDLYWMGLKHCDPLLALQKLLCANLIHAGFAFENKRFQPHLTLGRSVILKENIKPKQLDVPKITIPVVKISLMKSERINGVLTYTEIHSKKCV